MFFNIVRLIEEFTFEATVQDGDVVQGFPLDAPESRPVTLRTNVVVTQPKAGGVQLGGIQTDLKDTR
jgi:hypothetical protein